MAPLHALPIDPFFSSADEYVTSLLSFYRDPLFTTLCGGIHILDFFIKDSPTAPTTLYNSVIPEDWRTYLSTQQIPEILETLLHTPLNSLPSDAPESFRDFITKLRVHSLRRNSTSPDAVPETAPPKKRKTGDMMWALNAGMKPKKIHEVENFSRYVDHLTKSINTTSSTPLSHIVDYGSGQAYLCRTLAVKYGHNLVGLESRPINITGALAMDTHFTKLAASKNWVTLPGTLQYIETHIASGSLDPLLPEITPADTPKSLLLVSLHSCGNLIHHALRGFAQTPAVRAVALIGCCYNLLTERAGKTYKVPITRSSYPRLVEAANTADPHGFPISNTFEQKNVTLNITARSMACQAPTNWARGGSSDFFVRHFWRALLQRILADRGFLDDPSNPVILGSLKKYSYDSFHKYVNAAAVKMGWGEKMQLSVEEAEGYEREYKSRHKDLCVMWSLMAVAAGVVESLIVVDRWLFLREMEGVEAWVEQVFEYSESPRNLVVVGVRK